MLYPTKAQHEVEGPIGDEILTDQSSGHPLLGDGVFSLSHGYPILSNSHPVRGDISPVSPSPCLSPSAQSSSASSPDFGERYPVLDDRQAVVGKDKEGVRPTYVGGGDNSHEPEVRRQTPSPCSITGGSPYASSALLPIKAQKDVEQARGDMYPDICQSSSDSDGVCDEKSHRYPVLGGGTHSSSNGFPILSDGHPVRGRRSLSLVDFSAIDRNQSVSPVSPGPKVFFDDRCPIVEVSIPIPHIKLNKLLRFILERPTKRYSESYQTASL